VLRLYNLQSSVCSLALDLVGSKTDQQLTNSFYPDDGYVQGMPWLYYLEGRAPKKAVKVLKDSGRVKFHASFSYVNKDFGILKSLQFKLARYDILGNFFGFEDLDHQLFLCEVPNNDLERLMAIGTTLSKTCSIDLSRMLNPVERPSTTNMFYELYLVDYNGDLIDVPIKMLDLRDNSGDQPNAAANMDEWILTRRFFMVDTISGIEDIGGFQSGALPAVLRYAKRLTLKVQLDEVENEMIYPPHLEIKYEEKYTSEVLDFESQTGRFADIAFLSESSMDTTGFWEFAGTIFIVLMVLLGLIVLVFFMISAKADRL